MEEKRCEMEIEIKKEDIIRYEEERDRERQRETER